MPQAQSVPSARTATVWLPPPAALAQFVAVPTCPGVLRLVVVPSPSWPKLFWPQAQSVPSVRTATVWVLLPLAAALVQLVAVPTCPGVRLRVVVPLPSWPKPL